MQLDKVTAEIRPRLAEEAVDLGLALTRVHYARIFKLWATTVWPLCAVILAAFYQAPLWGLLMIIWIKPLFGRLPLLVLSRALFGAEESFRQQWRESWGPMRSHILDDLVLRRFSLSRSLHLPVSLLEGLRGRAARERRRLLSMRAGATAGTVTLQSGAFVNVLALGCLFLAAGLLPELQQFGAEAALDALMVLEDFQLPLILQWVLVISYLLALTLIEPFYIGAGFGLYLNARTLAEGWDIEIAFKRIHERLERGRARLIVVLGFGLLLGLVGDLPAAQMPAPVTHQSRVPQPGGEGRRKASEVLEDPAFEVKKQKISYYEPKWDDATTSGSGSAGSGALGLMTMELMRWLSLAFLGGLLAWVLWQAFKWLKASRVEAPELQRQASVSRVMGMSVTPETLPDQVGEKAWELWQSGRQAEAIALLYRAAISWWIHQAGVAMQESDTEADCLRRSESSPASAEAMGQFAQLTRMRVSAAYAGELPEASEFEGLCRDWYFVQHKAGAPDD